MPRINLVEYVMDDLKEFFHTTEKHRPSERMYSHLQLIPETIRDIIDGKAENNLYLSQLDAGIGKTSALRFTLQHMGNLVGSILCLETYAQIEQMVINLHLDRNQFCVLCKPGVFAQDERLEGRELVYLGIPFFRASFAQVLITTHSMLEAKLRDKSFTEAEAVGEIRTVG